MNANKRFDSLQFLRMIAFMAIFLLHTRSYHLITRGYDAAAAVSFFIMLSGFLYGYRYRNNSFDLKHVRKKIKKRILKVLPLHWVTLLLSVSIITGWNIINLKESSRTILLNAFLLQSYIPDSEVYFSFNGVSWYLCLVIFLIICNFPIIYVLKLVRNTRHGILKTWMIFILSVCAAFVYTKIIMKENLSPEFWLYIFPPSRLMEYICGIIIGMNYDHIKISFSTGWEIAVCVLYYAVMLFCPFPDGYSRGAYWIIPNAWMLIVFSSGKGRISKVFSHQACRWLGDISYECFMIHLVVIQFMNHYISPEAMSMRRRYILTLVCLLITLCLAAVWHEGEKRIENKIKSGSE